MKAPLPPLPPTYRGAAWLPTGPRLGDVLAGEHEALTALCDRTRRPGPTAARRQLVEVLAAEMARHVSVERQYLYPAVRAALGGGDQIAAHGIAEGTLLLRLLRRLRAVPPGGAGFEDLVAQVAAAWGRHRVGVGVPLSRLPEVLTEQELVRLGNRAEAVRESAPTRPHPSLPSGRPWTAIVDPLVGAVDKVRDLLSGRITYLGDLPDRVSDPIG